MPSMDGVLIVDKPAGITSHDVVARLRRIIGERRVGHTGTLDPFATGVLVMVIGRATRLAQFLSGADKEYEAVIRLGYSTDTGDFTGKRSESSSSTQAHVVSPVSAEQREAGGEAGDGVQPHLQSLPTRGEGSLPSFDEIEAAIASLRGEMDQVPPMFSAKKIAGRKLYEHARRGEQVDRQAVRVVVHEFELLDHHITQPHPNEDSSIELRTRIVCSAGTYVRILAEDLGKQLGIGAHLSELRRTRAGRFKLADAVALDELADLAPGLLPMKVLISTNEALSHLPSIDLDEEQARRTLHGIDFQLDAGMSQSWDNDESVRMVFGGQLIAVGRFDASSQVVHPSVVIGNQ